MKNHFQFLGKKYIEIVALAWRLHEIEPFKGIIVLQEEV